jgi:importin subunit beta-1
MVKKSTLQAIGFICEQVDPNILEAHSNSILTAVAHGANKEQVSSEVRFAAIQALYNSLEFIRGNFEREAERNYVMQIVCEATQSENSDIQLIAFECLVKIITLYYEKMSFYMEKALYGLTLLGMRHQNEKVVLQAIEFWSTLFEMEFDIMCENSQQEIPTLVCHNFSFSALQEITPLLLWLLTKKEEDDDEDEWNVSMASATCLKLLASCCGSSVVPHVLPFVEQNIKNVDWNFREAAVMAFGSILDGPEPKDVGKLVSLALPTLIQLMDDSVISVKDTAAWTLGRICELLFDILTDQELEQIVAAVVKGLNDTRRVATNCAWCIINLSEQTLGGEDQVSSKLDKYFETLLSSLTRVAERPDPDSNFRAATYEAISTLVTNSSNNSLETVSKLLQMVMQHLQMTVQMQHQVLEGDERRAHNELQSNLCGVLAAIIRRLSTQLKPVSDEIMQLLLIVISNASKNSTVMEDAFLAIGTLPGVAEQGFIRYMESFMPFLINALNNFEDHQMCYIAIGLVGDICSALGDQVLPFCETFINVAGRLLENPNAHRTIKPACLSLIGDIALAIGGNFENWMHSALVVIQHITDSLKTIPLVSCTKVGHSGAI